jgi:uncharacterized protein YndB with AHSA1/START domain
MYQRTARGALIDMIRVEQSRRYAASREAAFDYITDPQNWPDYWPDLLAVADLANARWRAPGDVMKLRMKLNGRPVDLRLRLDELEAPSRVAYRSVQAGLPDVAHERHFLADGGQGFEYRLAVSYEPRGGVAGVFDRTLVRYGLRRALRRTLDNLEGPLAAIG